MKQVLFRWSTGDGNSSIYRTNIAVASIQRFFPEASYCVLYNGKDFDKFCSELREYDSIIDFNNLILYKQQESDWPFKFDIIGGAWWKWAPFHLGIKPIEVFLDTDVLFLRKPQSIVDWVNSDSNMIAGYDCVCNLLSQNVGDFKRSLRGYTGIINVGIVGLKDNKWRNLFKMCANNIPMISPRSYHINEQGASNVALRDAERISNFRITRVSLDNFAWWQPFRFESAETVHFIAAQKIALEEFYSFFREVSICDDLSIYQKGFQFLQGIGYNRSNLDKNTYYEHCVKMDSPENAPPADWRRTWET